jgi:hypothetical protein
MVQSRKYIRVQEGGQQVFLAPVLKEAEKNKQLVDFAEL